MEEEGGVRGWKGNEEEWPGLQHYLLSSGISLRPVSVQGTRHDGGEALAFNIYKHTHTHTYTHKSIPGRFSF